jgi:hypothetical protein
MITQTVPAAPTGVPAWAIRAVAAVVAIVGPLLAWIDPGKAIPKGAVQAAVMLAFLVVGAIIFLVHLIYAAVHEYGWNLTAAKNVATDAEKELEALWPEFKDTYNAAKPALDALPGFTAGLASVTSEVDKLKASSGLNPGEVVAALEAATGMTFTRATPPAAAPAPPVAGSGGVAAP